MGRLIYVKAMLSPIFTAMKKNSPFVALICFLSLTTAQAQTTLQILPGEKWFGGAVNDAHLAPFQTGYELNMNGDTRGNQAAPLVLSTKGRFIWCDEPFKITINQNTLTIAPTKAPLTIDSTGQNLR